MVRRSFSCVFRSEQKNMGRKWKFSSYQGSPSSLLQLNFLQALRRSLYKRRASLRVELTAMSDLDEGRAQEGLELKNQLNLDTRSLHVLNPQ